MRPTDLAREHGLSTQAVRNYEEAGILPAAARGPQGYRLYTAVHAQALRTFLALRPGFGHGVSARILSAVNENAFEVAFRLIDEGHAALLRDRRTLDEVACALGDLTAGPPADPDSLSIGELAHRLAVHPATLRKWEAAGILRPARSRAGHRTFDAAAIRDAHLAHQLRRGGYPLARIAAVVAQVRSAGGAGPLEEALQTWRARLDARSRAMLTGAAELAVHLRLS
ncbi:MerR family DNA-binding transcriptional regulator [Amycolatopsis sp. FDAARGOS 1241]|uniref:MerR family DNA-binding transcriptional regulator n=1 Tax=Amycolatopsis sp. FDAARGOS 1241 TaxID=2778070 RepID=UPI00194EEA70|nr:MerR family DNA-binding transcriptional regulator [Amycolatopsis sp. FDAARGOS 1241]QRP51252.1 MerR family DNA-binding transcriptional regulator [Amycolatopsis sp. FDAARGOS 1241]